MQHIEFFHTEHFENNYYRIPPSRDLSLFIDFFWETRFEDLWTTYPKGFSDAQFPNIGYTYLFNLGTDFVMQVNDQKFQMRSDGFLPRYNPIECFHQPGNHLFGIKFRISPVILTKKVDFSEYKGFIYPLSYLMDQHILETIKKAASFEERVEILSLHFLSLLHKEEFSPHPIHIVSRILEEAFQQNRFTISIEQLAQEYSISSRTLQRYFEVCTGISSKQALQIMRIRKATSELVNNPTGFQFSNYGYFDHSHFYKHLRSFLEQNTFHNTGRHLPLLEKLHRK